MPEGPKPRRPSPYRARVEHVVDRSAEDGRRIRSFLRADTSSDCAERYLSSAMKIFMVGAGQVGTTILEALRGEHEFRVVDRDHERLAELVPSPSTVVTP